MSNQVTVDSVLWAYRLLLDREPENLDIIGEKIANFQTNQELVRDLMNSEEFSSKRSHILLNNDGQIPVQLKTERTPIIHEEHSALMYAELGAKAKQENNLEDAEIYYQKALLQNYNLPEHIYLEFKTIQHTLGKETEAIETYKKWIEKEYLVEHQNKVIYCPIAKNACTLLKNVLIEISDKQEDFKKSDLKIHKYIDCNKNVFQLDRFDYINQDDYFKFVILRNPFKRLVSTYADKFVNRLDKNDPHALPAIEEIYQYFGLEPDFKKSITFSQFVDYLLRTEDCQLDSHWRPQSIYFASNLVKFDYIGQFENLDRVITDLEQKLNVKMDSGVSKHRTKYGSMENTEKFHKLYPYELKSLGSFPKSSQFYTQEIEAKVRARYSQDIEIYEESFATKLAPIDSD